MNPNLLPFRSDPQIRAARCKIHAQHYGDPNVAFVTAALAPVNAAATLYG